MKTKQGVDLNGWPTFYEDYKSTKPVKRGRTLGTTRSTIGKLFSTINFKHVGVKK